MIIDMRASVSLTGKSRLNNYCKDMKIQLNDLDSAECFKNFNLGIKLQLVGAW